MATVSAFSSLRSLPTFNSRRLNFPSISLFSTGLHFKSRKSFSNSFNHLTSTNSTKGHKNSFLHGIRRLKSVEEETQIAELEEEEGTQVQGEDQQQTVSVPVSSSDTLTMFFQAEGTMNETSIPTVTKALEGSDGISHLKVQVVEGIASVELTKLTTVQATEVASSLVELIQGSGFKLQTLNLSFVDEEDALV